MEREATATTAARTERVGGARWSRAPFPRLRPALRPSDAAIREAPARSAVQRRDRRYRWSLATADVGAVAFAVWLCTSVLGSDGPTLAVLLALPAVVLLGKVFGLYERDELVLHKTTVEEAPKLFHLATFYALLFWLAESVVVEGALSSFQVLGLWGALFSASFGGRYLARHAAAAISPVERCVLVGEEDAYLRLRDKLALENARVELVSHRPLDAVLLAGRHRVDEGALDRIVAEERVDRLVIATGQDNTAVTLDLVRAAKVTGARVSVIPHMLQVVGTTGVFDEVHGMTLIGVRRFGMTKSSLMLKRTFDLLGAGLGLLIISPLLAVLALAVKLDSRGPVLFGQERVGRDGRRFCMLKFRTMVDGADAMKLDLRTCNEAGTGLFKIAGDPRITRVGAWLRRTSLDELPQLLNVLGGKMSLVGPRPLVLDEDEQITGWQRRRLQLTPGMTGHWQIAGSSRVPLAEMVKIDYLYIAGWSLWADVKILLRTVPYILARRGM